MLTCVLLILFGQALTYYSLKTMDCENCWHREWENLRAAKCGFAIVVVGCIMACVQFWTYC